MLIVGGVVNWGLGGGKLLPDITTAESMVGIKQVFPVCYQLPVTKISTKKQLVLAGHQKQLADAPPTKNQTFTRPSKKETTKIKKNLPD